MRYLCTKFHQNPKLVSWLICYMYFEDFAPTCPRDWVRAYLPLQYFKSAKEEHMHQVSSISPSMSVSPFVIHIMEILPHPTLKDWLRLIYPFNTLVHHALRAWVWTYLPVQNFKSGNEKPMYQIALKLY
ncbi:hypothetical protein AVEN_196891-1 [Araneus ventricosus]|uniref:Uncharacterized protein n=1 Tax=Araneus ventricosus TaxID=182803 RepID=A0A4Y2ECT0_ARAVE|nr:hypothetical protein AVEN_196891-1 [Araneus ventricosus]